MNLTWGSRNGSELMAFLTGSGPPVSKPKGCNKSPEGWVNDLPLGLLPQNGDCLQSWCIRSFSRPELDGLLVRWRTQQFGAAEVERESGSLRLRETLMKSVLCLLLHFPHVWFLYSYWLATGSCNHKTTPEKSIPSEDPLKAQPRWNFLLETFSNHRSDSFSELLLHLPTNHLYCKHIWAPL